MSSYDYLATFYDSLTQDVDYECWADYYEAHFAQQSRPVHSVLDLGCGTGSLVWCLAERGYETIGVDKSEEMLAEAQMKQRSCNEPPLFLCQSMDELDLYGTVDAAICMLDGVNYILSPSQLKTVFSRVLLFLEPGGIFIFDINTATKLRGLDGQVFLDENDDVYCVWRVEMDEDSRICSYHMDIFENMGSDLWQRDYELHQEYAYETQQLEQLLKEVGFEDIHFYGELEMSPPEKDADRIFIKARKPKLEE